MTFQQAVGTVATGFEVVGVGLLTIGAVVALVRYARALLRRQDSSAAYRTLRQNLGNAILLGLEFLVAGDIIRTVAVEATLSSVVILGLIVAIRTFLSWSLEVEIDGQWPWQRARSGEATPERSAP